MIAGIIMFLFAGKPANNTNTSSRQADSLFVVIYTTGSEWNTSKTPDEQPYFADHSAFMMKLRKETTTLLGARYSDKGMLVIKSASLQQAQQLISSDKAVIHKTFNAEVHPANFFFTGCVK